MRPIFLPPCLGFSCVLIVSAVDIDAVMIDPSTDGPVNGGLLTTVGSNPNILPNALW